MEREVTPIQKQEGTAAASGDRGAPVLFERTSDGKYKRPHVNDDGAVEVAISGSPTVDTELSTATLLADGDAIPTAGKVGAVIMAKNASGTLDIGELAAVMDSAPAGTEKGVVTRNIPSGTQTISGTVTANLGTIAGVATETTLSALNAKVTACNTGAVVVSSSALPTGAATAAKQDETTAQVSPYNGSGVNGTKDLTSANTWYAVPSTVPTADYLLVVTRESVAGTLRWGFSNASTPSATNGNLFTSESLVLRMAANQSIYVGSTTAGDDVNWTTKEI